MCFTCLPCIGVSAVAGYKVRSQCSAWAPGTAGLPTRRRRSPQLRPPLRLPLPPCSASVVFPLLLALQVNKTVDKAFSSKQPQEPVEPGFVTEAKLRWNVSATLAGAAAAAVGRGSGGVPPAAGLGRVLEQHGAQFCLISKRCPSCCT